jgi:hypothetical protein
MRIKGKCWEGHQQACSSFSNPGTLRALFIILHRFARLERQLQVCPELTNYIQWYQRRPDFLMEDQTELEGGWAVSWKGPKGGKGLTSTCPFPTLSHPFFL